MNLLLGTEGWYDEFYRVEKAEASSSLFATEDDRVIKASVASIGRYFNERLKTIFAGVAEHPGVLRNSTNSPLYLLCFAVGNGNPRAKEVALRIAEHILKDLR